MNKETLLASEIDDCSICPIEEECHRSCREGWEGPCVSWNGDEEIYEGWLEDQYFLAEERYELQLKEERSWKAKRNAEIRKQYTHLNDKVKKIKEWLPKSDFLLIVTARRKDKLYMRTISKRKANYVFDLEKEKLYICQGKVSLADLTVFNKFENDFHEMYYGDRPEDRDFVKEAIDRVNKNFWQFVGEEE